MGGAIKEAFSGETSKIEREEIKNITKFSPF